MAKTRVLVLGGGMGSLAALCEITSKPNWAERFDITVLQQGWRLGGKCSSGRNPNHRYRNEEHGLHVLGGFYHNTFKMLRSCYEEWNAYFPHAIPFNDAFAKKDGFQLAQKLPSGWSYATVPPLNGHGQPGIDPPTLTPLEIAKALTKFLRDIVGGLPPDLEVYGKPGQLFSDSFTATADEFDSLHLNDLDQSRIDELAGSLKLLEVTIQHLPPDALLRPPQTIQPDDPELGKIMELAIIELGLLLPRALLVDKIVFHGFDVVNDDDALQWIRKHGASDRLLQSTFLNSGYEYAFAYVDGDPTKKDFAAGVALRGLLRLLLTYHWSIFVHMQGGMGEIVIAPLYEVLRKRGVKFKFFHQVTRLALNDDGSQIATVDGFIQAGVTAGADGYDPLVDWNGRKSWPIRPKYELLINGDVLERQGKDFESYWADTADMPKFELNKDSDFDVVVLGISVGALRGICRELIGKHSKWQRFIAAQKTTPTLGVQFWLLMPITELGWEGPPPLLTGYERPLSTWADMSFLLDLEGERDILPYYNLSYLCGPFPRSPVIAQPPDATFPERETARAGAAFKTWLRLGIPDLIPLAANAQNDDFREDLKPETYIRANINPSDEYVLSTAGSIALRFKTDETGVDNLFVVGDWIKTGVDVGAVEAAVMSGLQCSRAITGTPQYIYGETDF
jgi:uncharacterized protein with NAD-binding domain and iron-sulfur cluster